METGNAYTFYVAAAYAVAGVVLLALVVHSFYALYAARRRNGDA